MHCTLKELTGLKGFTLLEVLVALMIIGIALGTVFQAFSVSRSISMRADHMLEATRIAKNLLADPAIMKMVLENEDSFDFAGTVPDESGWRFSFSGYPLALESETDGNPIDIPSVMETEVCVYHESDTNIRRFCLTRWFRKSAGTAVSATSRNDSSRMSRPSSR